MLIGYSGTRAIDGRTKALGCGTSPTHPPASLALLALAQALR